MDEAPKTSFKSKHVQKKRGGWERIYLAIHDDLVVDAELALGHPGQVALHHHLPRHVGGQNLHIKIFNVSRPCAHNHIRSVFHLC
jgi:hypothetical protein